MPCNDSNFIDLDEPFETCKALVVYGQQDLQEFQSVVDPTVEVNDGQEVVLLDLFGLDVIDTNMFVNYGNSLDEREKMVVNMRKPMRCVSRFDPFGRGLRVAAVGRGLGDATFGRGAGAGIRAGRVRGVGGRMCMHWKGYGWESCIKWKRCGGRGACKAIGARGGRVRGGGRGGRGGRGAGGGIIETPKSYSTSADWSPASCLLVFSHLRRFIPHSINTK
ncbi:hypothetical protein L1887_10077 [Cichorium endivia]|nr:hypothetical protein L1887_10077 [Cichorium endivia]